MKCPACTDVDLVMTERQNVEIDYCPKCRGVWLDRGELDKIIERSAAQSLERPMAGRPPAEPYGGYGKQGQRGSHGEHGYRRRSWLHELFD
ncbi:MAG: zf-TFIIB domain-containing protein [Pseudomonadota bacterium]